MAYMDAIKLIKEKKAIYERLFVLIFRQMDRDKIDATKFIEDFLKVQKACKLIDDTKLETAL